MTSCADIPEQKATSSPWSTSLVRPGSRFCVSSRLNNNARFSVSIGSCTRSLALHSLFRLIHIYLGAFELTHPALNDRGDDASEPNSQASTRSLDILDGTGARPRLGQGPISVNP
jgi:hypothetical protein